MSWFHSLPILDKWLARIARFWQSLRRAKQQQKRVQGYEEIKRDPINHHTELFGAAPDKPDRVSKPKRPD